MIDYFNYFILGCFYIGWAGAGLFMMMLAFYALKDIINYEKNT